VKALEFIGDLSRHKDSSGLHLGHRWLTHFGCASGFLGLCHTFFGWGFILGCGAYWQSSSLKRCLGCFGHFVLMCSSLTFLSHTNRTSFFILSVSFNGFQQESYINMWGHYGSKILGVFLRPLNEASCLTTDILWWYRPFFYGKVCPIWFSRELGSGGSIFLL
jgi:hypothetical protein